MNQDAKTVWLNALRTKGHVQHFGSLTNDSETAFCPLGVLIYEYKLGPTIDKCTHKRSDICPIWDTFFNLNQKQRDEIAHKNDKERQSFLEIADFIEANY